MMGIVSMNVVASILMVWWFMILCCISFHHSQHTSSTWFSTRTKARILLHAAPNSILFRVQRIEGKGMGVIAARDVYTGELIMNETPLLSLSTEANTGGKPSKDDYVRVLQVVQDKVQGLSLREQERFYALSGYIRDTFDDDDDDDDDDDETTLSSSKEIEEPSVLDIFRTNALPMSKGYAGIFPDLARLNSHCQPNLHYSWDETKQSATVYALRTIHAGEEMNICYMGPCFPKRDRRGYLSHNFGFTCTCSVCSLRGDEAMESDHRRASLAGLEQAAQQVIATKNGELALTIVDHRLRMLRNEGIDNPANVYFCELDVFYALMGISKETEPSTLQQLLTHSHLSQQQSQLPNNLTIAYEWINRAYQNAVLCKGRDSSAAIRCQQYMNVLKDCIPN